MHRERGKRDRDGEDAGECQGAARELRETHIH
jgi:hypothetical protein